MYVINVIFEFMHLIFCSIIIILHFECVSYRSCRSICAICTGRAYARPCKQWELHRNLPYACYCILFFNNFVKCCTTNGLEKTLERTGAESRSSRKWLRVCIKPCFLIKTQMSFSSTFWKKRTGATSVSNHFAYLSTDLLGIVLTYWMFVAPLSYEHDNDFSKIYRPLAALKECAIDFRKVAIMFTR